MATRSHKAAGAASGLPRTVLLDADVFFAPRMRDLFMHLREQELIRLHWTRPIEKEWARNVVAKQGANRDAIQNCLRGMREAVEDWEVDGFERYAAKFEAVDEKDRHVAAAAFKLSKEEWPGRPVALVTKNVKDFPQHAFKGTQITRYSMSAYLDLLYEEDPETVLKVVEVSRKRPQFIPGDIRDTALLNRIFADLHHAEPDWHIARLRYFNPLIASLIT